MEKSSYSTVSSVSFDGANVKGSVCDYATEKLCLFGVEEIHSPLMLTEEHRPL